MINTDSELTGEVDCRLACEFRTVDLQEQVSNRFRFNAAGLLTVVWGVLVGMTLLNAFIADRAEPSKMIISVICMTVAVKGALVIDSLMALRNVLPVIRWMMLSYFLIMSSIIALAVSFPEVLARLTTL